MLRDLYPQLIKELDKRFKLTEEEEDDYYQFRDYHISYEINGSNVLFTYGDLDYTDYFSVDYKNSEDKVVVNLTIIDKKEKGLKDFNVFKERLNYEPTLTHIDGWFLTKGNKSFDFPEDLDTVVGYVVEAIREALDARLKV